MRLGRISAVGAVIGLSIVGPAAGTAQAVEPAIAFDSVDSYIYFDSYTSGDNQHYDDAESQQLTASKTLPDGSPTGSISGPSGSANASAKFTHAVTLGAGNATDGYRLKRMTASGRTTASSALTGDPNDGIPGAYSESTTSLSFEVNKSVAYTLTTSLSPSTGDADNCSYASTTLDGTSLVAVRYQQSGGGCGDPQSAVGDLSGLLMPGSYDLEMDIYSDVDSETGSASSTVTGSVSIEFGAAIECDNEVPTTGAFIEGTNGDDVLCGGPGNDTIHGLDGGDTIYGFGGNDKIFPQAGIGDSADGGPGNDTMIGGDGVDALIGGDGDDRIDGGSGGDLLYGMDGDDTMTGGDGDDYMSGRAGHDDISGNGGDDELLGDEDGDILDGGEGQDRIVGHGGGDIITGGPDHDVLHGNAGRDTVDGGDGPDRLVGEAKRDDMTGGAGKDRIEGGGGDDHIEGGGGNDTLTGNDGEDVITGNSGEDAAFGGPGADSFKMCDGNQDEVYGGGGTNKAKVDGNDILFDIAGEWVTIC
jgi:Ca2+-binding RTX toxin-like protein